MTLKSVVFSFCLNPDTWKMPTSYDSFCLFRHSKSNFLHNTCFSQPGKLSIDRSILELDFEQKKMQMDFVSSVGILIVQNRKKC